MKLPNWIITVKWLPLLELVYWYHFLIFLHKKLKIELILGIRMP
jgi:hypothetical protein